MILETIQISQNATLTAILHGPSEEMQSCGYLITAARVVLVDDENALQGVLRRIAREKRWTDGSVGQFLYDFFEQLIARDLHRLEKLEDRIEALEDRVLADELDGFSAPMTALRKETSAWFRYYSQLDDVACELRENENGFFSDGEQLLFRMFEDRVIRLREESQLLRESCTQVQSLFQAEIDIRQNRIMQILTIVTTIFLPLTLLGVAGVVCGQRFGLKLGGKLNAVQLRRLVYAYIILSGAVTVVQHL